MELGATVDGRAHQPDAQFAKDRQDVMLQEHGGGRRGLVTGEDPDHREAGRAVDGRVLPQRADTFEVPDGHGIEEHLLTGGVRAEVPVLGFDGAQIPQHPFGHGATLGGSGQSCPCGAEPSSSQHVVDAAVGHDPAAEASQAQPGNDRARPFGRVLQRVGDDRVPQRR